jgi:UDP-GlcNAc:undecaprenyl-phosphate GlcNAc-1-phosphate transferase
MNWAVDIPPVAGSVSFNSLDGVVGGLGSYLLVFVVAAVCCALFMPLTGAVAQRLGAMDDTRKPPVPRIGGVAIALGAFTALVLVGVVFVPTGLTLLATSRSLGLVLAGTLAILVLGVVDDMRPVPAWAKFAVQVGVAAVMYAVGLRVGLLSLPFGPVDLGPVLGFVVTVLWLVGITNAFNLLDGADGVATGSAFFAATAVFLMSVALGHPAIGLVAAALAGALLGFLPFNFPPAKAFLGDSGSMATGFLLAGLAVEGSTKGPTLVAIAVPLVAFGVPVFDTTITLIRRSVRGRPLFEPDQEHVHHRLARAGLSPRQVAGVIYAASALFALVAMIFINPGVRSIAVALLVVGAGVWVTARYLHLHELNELARLARRGALQPRAIAANVELRRAAERLEHAKTLDDIKRGIALLPRATEFDEVLLLIAPAGERRGKAKVWHLQEGEFVEHWPERSPDEWEVVCPFEGEGWIGEVHLRRRLGRRSLLLDLNLLLELVQPTLSQAAKRIESPITPTP